MREVIVLLGAWKTTVPFLFLLGIGLAGNELKGIAKDSRFSVANLSAVLGREGGEVESLPRGVSEAAEIVSWHIPQGVPVRLEQSLDADPLIQQRMWEHLYPVRFSQKDAKYEISWMPGPDPQACRIIERGKHVVLAECR
ncbi:hypothetical protein [Xanthomonas campestris]|uniref:hypothetical protein n=1 Tax=Xanthomonas campestris TaxID=339 RepID=UPI000E1F9934|nr:hypothetical protein [Xanthomonas campestris]